MSSGSRGLPARLGALALLVAFAWPDFAAAASRSSLPDVPNHVLDQTGTLDAGQVATLERKLAGYETRGGAQVIVVVVPTTGTDSIEAYAVALFEKNAFGRKGEDDGVLLLVAKDDRAVRIEVGYGLEGTIPDIHANRLIEEHLVPAFRAGDFHGGIDRTTDAIIALVDAERGIAAPAAPAAALVDAPQAVAATEPRPADEAGRPVDDPYVQDPDRRLDGRLHAALSQKLAAFEQRTGHRIYLVLTGSASQPLAALADDARARYPPPRPGDYIAIVANGAEDRAEVFAGEGLATTIGAVERQRIVSEALVPKLFTERDYAALDAASDIVIARVDGVEPPAKHDVVLPPSAPPPADEELPVEAWIGLSVIGAVVGLFVAIILQWTPRPVRAAFGAAAAGAVAWHLQLRDVPSTPILLLAMLAGATVAGLISSEWLARNSGGSGRSSGGRSSGGSRSSRSSSRSSGGRSGGGGASGRW